MSKEDKPNKHVVWRAILSILLLGMLGLSFSGNLDDLGAQYTSEGFKRSLVTFAVARGLNGVISVAQETELVLQPVGVGVTLAPGQILDPVNDLIERFSWVMLASTTSLGVQNVLLEVARWPWFSVVLVVLAVIWAWFNWIGKGVDKDWSVRVSRLLLLGLVLRFAVPAIALASEGVYQVFLEPRYETSIEKMQQASDQVQLLNESLEQQPNLLERAKKFVQSAGDGFSIKKKMAEYQEAASQASESAIELLVVFFVQTILLPLFFLWLAFKGAKYVAGGRW